jgi:hypothetical protein
VVFYFGVLHPVVHILSKLLEELSHYEGRFFNNLGDIVGLYLDIVLSLNQLLHQLSLLIFLWLFSGPLGNNKKVTFSWTMAISFQILFGVLCICLPFSSSETIMK